MMMIVVRFHRLVWVLFEPQVMFNDHLLHGSAARTNPGDRKMIVFRYLPQEQSTNRFGYEPSSALMQRLTPVRRQVSMNIVVYYSNSI